VNTQAFSVQGRVAVITGGYGVLGGDIATGLAAAGARVVILGRRAEQAEAAAVAIRSAGGDAMSVVADVVDEAAVRRARDEVVARCQRVDVLVNAAGGNVARARSDARPAYDVPTDAFEEVLRLNLHGSVVPSLVFAETMAAQRGGSIINISSMAAMRAISGVLGYSIAKSGIDSLTRWLAVDMARRFGDGIRVNAIAPGFFVTTQNRDVLITPDGSWTDRSLTILAHTPMGRFGRPEELLGAVQWLASDASSFVTGTVIPVDGGFSAFSGV
jgi:NAD(P)-dependent dehydrogenase (short-subunit alcohol dehydrogenase family)